MWPLVKLLTQFLSLVLFLLHFHAISSLLPFSNESNALSRFKNSFSNHNSHYSHYSFPKTQSWREGTNCCLWNGVTCDMKTGYVIELNLSSSMLYGTFPFNSSLFFLSHLQHLDLSYNNFNGSPISPHFGHFLNLRYLNLNNSNFVGQIPSEISLLSKLVSLDLSRNVDSLFAYGLSIETTVFNNLFRNLTMLKELDLSFVDMSLVEAGSFMNLSSSLSSLKLYGCGLLQKSLEYIAQFKKLVSLDLSYNFYDRSIKTLALDKLVQNLTILREMNLSLVSPNSLMNLSSSLSFLTLKSCQLSGEFPGALLQLPNLRLLDLTDNEDIIGFSPPASNWSDSFSYLYLSNTKIPIDFVSNLKTLEEVDLRGCNFVGSNLALLGNLTQLNELYLSPNNFGGIKIPYSFGNLVKLTSLDLSACNFSGQIPSSLGNLKQLSKLDLSHNNLDGQIPFSFENLKHLSNLDLSYNNLNGTLLFLGNLEQLSYLDLSNNILSGHIPSSLGNLTQLSVLYLSNNNLCGFIPNSFANLSQLQLLYSSNNQLIGHIPSRLGRLSNLSFLDLSNNLLNETIPISLFTLPSLNILDLHNNLLEGEIVQFQHNSSVNYIDLSNNKLHGPVPNSIFELVDLEALVLSSNNKLSGGISSSVCKMQKLQILDLSNNTLRGLIPKCLGNFSNRLEFLHLGMNNFSGTIPPTFSKGNSLKYINFYSNHFQGQVPRSLINCTNLEYLDLSDNMIMDTFPFFLGALPKLRVLLLRSNKLYGLVQKFSPNYSFSSLQIFDLSNNNLSGPLPSEYFDHLEAMQMITSDSYVKYMREYSPHDYDYFVQLTVKGLQIEWRKSSTILSTMDFSQNKFTAKIPRSIGKLKALIQLNLSHNCLDDDIPTSLGNLTNLESLDLSSNFLVGRIPMQLQDLIFLQVFNVSYNQLEGLIPNGKQFKTFDQSSYEGNKGLCGFPVSLTKECNVSGKAQQLNPSKEQNSESSDENGFGWEAVVVGYGCGVIYGVGVGYILFKRKKHSWFVKTVEAQGDIWGVKFDHAMNKLQSNCLGMVANFREKEEEKAS